MKLGRFGRATEALWLAAERPVRWAARRTLTENHVPPSGSSRSRRLVVRSLVGDLRTPKAKGRFHQSGLSFHSICAECNEHRLGREYDPELKRLCEQLRQTRSASSDLGMSLPNPVRISCKPQRVARAVVGHLISAVPQQRIGAMPLDTPFWSVLRSYVMNPGSPLPRSISIRLWHYPFERVVVANAIGKVGPGTPYVSSLLKFDPIAFWLIFQAPESFSSPIPQLHSDRTISLDQDEFVPFDMASTLNKRFPEAPSDAGATMFHDQAGWVAEPKLHRSRGHRRRRARRTQGPIRGLTTGWS